MRYGISTRQNGAMSPMRNDINRRRYFEQIGLVDRKIIAAGLVHGNTVALVDSQSSTFISATDGLLTTDPSVVLTVTVADCFPVYFSDPVKNIVGIAHVGWQGANLNIVKEIIEFFDSLDSQREDITITLGPGICTRHYPVTPERAAHFSSYPDAVNREGERVHLDIKKVIVAQLHSLGIQTIEDMKECTYEHTEKYFSYRRDKPEKVDPQVAWITLT